MRKILGLFALILALPLSAQVIQPIPSSAVVSSTALNTYFSIVQATGGSDAFPANSTIILTSCGGLLCVGAGNGTKSYIPIDYAQSQATLQNMQINDVGSSSITSGTSNFGAGYFAMQKLTTGTFNSCEGMTACQNLTTGQNNSANGYQALLLAVASNRNAATGSASLRNLNDGNDNTADGYGSLNALTTGGFNTASGSLSCSALTTGTQNVCFGQNAGTTANGNTAMTTDGANTIVGYQAGKNTASIITNSMCFGFNCQFNLSHQAVFGDLGIVQNVFSGGWVEASNGRTVNTGTASDTVAANKSTTFESANTAAGAFTVTLAAPAVDGERRRVCFKNATGTVTWTVTSPATAVSGLPTTFIAGQCTEMVYNSVAGTPTNSPATTWLVY